MSTLDFDQATLSEARRFNRKLAWAPRFKIRHRVVPRLIQSLLQLSQIGGDARLRRRGLQVQQRSATVGDAQVPVRLIRPAGPIKGIVLDIHGGGWVIGNAQMDDEQNAAMALQCQVLVVSVDYRLFDSAPMAGLMEDVLVAARWTLGVGLPEFQGLPVIVVGESAGGHLAAAMLLQLQQWPALARRIKGALLYYGVYDLTGTASVRNAGADTLVLDGAGMVQALRMLTPDLTDAQRALPPLSPLHGDLAGMPPALMWVGTLDPLHDDTTDMAARWRSHADVELHVIPDAPHGFIHFPTRMAAQVLAHGRQWISDRLRDGV